MDLAKGTPMNLRHALDSCTLHPALTGWLSLTFGLAVQAVAVGPLRAQTEVYTLPGTDANGKLGAAIAPLGDVDADGVLDFAKGSPGENGARGRVRIVSGGDGSTLAFADGASAGDNFGAALAGIGDVDGDGVPELIVGAPKQDVYFPPTNTVLGKAGSTTIVSGATGAKLDEKTVPTADLELGYAVAPLGDADGDGAPDYAVGAPGYGNDRGQVLLHFSTLPSQWTLLNGFAAGDRFGAALANVGDMDGDGVDELAVGAPGTDGLFASSDVGAGYVYSMANVQLLFATPGYWTGARLGTAVAAAGDINGDGRPDVAFGGPFNGANGPEAGRVEVVSGQGPTHTQLQVFVGPSGSRFGSSIAGVGDWDGDGFDDIAVGAPAFDFVLPFGQPLPDSGYVAVLSPKTGATLTSWLHAYSFARFGSAVASVGDLNGDGRDDVAAGAPLYDGAAGVDTGLVRVFLADAPPPSKYCTAKLNSAGCTPSIGASGAPSLSIGDGFHVTSFNQLNRKVGLLMWAGNQAAIPFGGGTLCLGAPMGRTPLQFSAGSTLGTDCSGTFDFWFSQAFMQSKNLSAGQPIYAQYWSRDPGYAAPQNIALSNALAFEILP